MGYKVENEFDYLGLKCVVLALDYGHRCGYVGISQDHPLFGIEYGDKTNVLNDSNLSRQEISIKDAGLGQTLAIMTGAYDKDFLSPEMFFDVHGGITYSGGGINSEYPIKSDLWWFGYDCSHCDDAKDLSLITNPILLEIEQMFPTSVYGTVRTLDYCIDECKKLADQLIEIK